MDEHKRKDALEAMRQALKDGRNRRWIDLHKMADAVHLAVANTDDYRSDRHSPEADDLGRQLGKASARRMLVRDVVETLDTKGRLVSKEMSFAEVKQNEPYQKRPSVRASKKHRDVSGRSM